MGWPRSVRGVSGVTSMLDRLVNCLLKALEGNLTRWQRIAMRSRSSTLFHQFIILMFASLIMTKTPNNCINKQPNE